MKPQRYLAWSFDKQCLHATRVDGSQVRFSRREALILERLLRQPGQLVARQVLLGLLDDGAGAPTAKALELAVTRIRQRLGDNARQPRYIATRYGEGYVWIAEQRADPAQQVFLAIGPLCGMSDALRAARPLFANLCQQLRGIEDWPGSIVLAPDWIGAGDGPAVRYNLECSLYRSDADQHGAFVLRHAGSARVLGTFRLNCLDADDAALASLATQLRTCLWADMALPEAGQAVPQDTPAEVRMHEVGKAFTSRTDTAWQITQQHVRIMAAAQPQERAALAVAQALGHYDRIVHQMRQFNWLTAEAWDALDDDIESQVMDSLAGIRDNPVLLLAASKLLLYLGRGHFDLALGLARDAFERSTAFAAAFTTLGQFHMCQGDFDQALQLYDNGIALYEPGSEAQVYTLVLKGMALMAASRQDALQKLRRTLFAVKPDTRANIGFLLVHPDDVLPHDLDAILGSLPLPTLHAILTYMDRLSGKSFQDRAHRASLVRGLAVLAQRRHGSEAVPASLAWVLAADDLRPGTPVSGSPGWAAGAAGGGGDTG